MDLLGVFLGVECGVAGVVALLGCWFGGVCLGFYGDYGGVVVDDCGLSGGVVVEFVSVGEGDGWGLHWDGEVVVAAVAVFLEFLGE